MILYIIIFIIGDNNMSLYAIHEEIFPTEKQEKQVWQFFGACRFIYNYMLERNKKIYARRKEKTMSYNKMQNLLPELKEVFSWLKNIDACALQHSCRNLSNAYHKFFIGQAKKPKYKSRKSSYQSYTTNGLKPNHITREYIKLPIIGKVKWYISRDINNIKVSPTISYKNGKYFVSIVMERKDNNKVFVKNDDKVIGLDYKSNGLYVDNFGNCCNMPDFYRRSQKRLKRLQRRLSKILESHIIGYTNRRKPIYDKKLSSLKNYQKQSSKVAKFSEHVANQREDFLHKKSTAIAKQYDLICVENINMQELSSNKFKNGKYTIKMGKATLDNGYGMFLNMLEYKLKHLGKELIKIDKYFPSSQLCSNCGYINHEIKDLKIRKWTCPHCGKEHDRDINSAINIRNEGLRIYLAKQKLGLNPS